jgi:hypothetical protein
MFRTVLLRNSQFLSDPCRTGITDTTVKVCAELISGPEVITVIKRLLALALALVTVMFSGCADKDWMIRKPGVESTIGNDPNKAPAGKVIPPPGMGVDLGARSPDAPNALQA